MSDDQENKVPQFLLKEDGGVYHNQKGKSSLLAKYDGQTGRVTFESFAIDQKYRSQVIRAITEDAMTGEQTGNRIKGYAIAGRPKDVVKRGEPPQPKKNPQFGDKTPDFVRWLFKWRPQSAYARYGVFLDGNGDPRTAECYRVERGLLKEQVGSGATEIGADGKDVLGLTEIRKEEGILATRATCMTFLLSEVVKTEGDSVTDSLEDNEDREADPEDSEADAPKVAETDDDEDPKPKRGRAAAASKSDDDEAD